MCAPFKAERRSKMQEIDRKTQYNLAYAKKKLKRIPLDVQKEKYDEIQSAANAVGESVNGYIKKAIDERMERDNQITKASHEDNPPADHTHRKAESGNASRNAFDERREQLLRQYEDLTSTAGQEGTKSSSSSQRKKPEPDPDTHPRETLDEKMERLYKEHGRRE